MTRVWNVLDDSVQGRFGFWIVRREKVLGFGVLDARRGKVLVARQGKVLFFFVKSYSHEAYLDYGGVHFDRFPAAVRAMAARCKLSFAIHPGLSQEDRRCPKEMTTERQKRKHILTSLPRMP